MHKSATKCNETLGKWCKNKHGASKIMDTLEMYQLLTHHSRGRHGDEEGLRWWFPSPAGCREELLDPPDLASTTTMACSMFSRKKFGPLGFSHRGEYIGGRAMSGGGPGAHPLAWRGMGVARAMAWHGRFLAPLHLCFGLCLTSRKIGTLAFVLSNSENISCVTFLKHKNSRKQGTGTVASR
jgi:hypothetical protein